MLSLVALAVAVVSLVGFRPTNESATKMISPPTTNAAGRAPTITTVVTTSLPVRLVIPSIGVSTTIGTVGLQTNGHVQVPTSIHTVSWYRNGPTPGALGSSVILGHVDSYTGPGVFFHLRDVTTGSVILVRLADGQVLSFTVTRVVQFAKASFPDQLVYGPRGTRSLNLVTCGGVFNHATGHYESNIVVFSTLTGASAH
ncbi:MAG TPA: class F sortase [Acidimicrobiales bacterium]|nr:class F sortase [Acidimicrobiales bacterium]